MSLTTTSNRVVATGDNSTVTFAFNRLLYDATHLQVYLAGVLQSTGYTVSGVPGASTSVTFTVAPSASVQVLMLRVVPLTQLSVYAVGGAFPAATTEKNLDLLMMGNQQFDEELDRAVKLPVSSTLTAANLPDPALAANYGKGVKIAGDGSGLDTFNINAGNISGTVTTKGDIHIFGAATEDRLPVGADEQLLTADSTAARGLAYKYLSALTIFSTIDRAVTRIQKTPANPIINGAMDVWQHGVTFSAAATNAYLADLWKWRFVGTGVVTARQSTNVPSISIESGPIFNYSLEIDVTTLDAAIAAGDLYVVEHIIEGFNWRHFAQRQFVLTFDVMSTKTGTHCVAFRNSGADRSYIATYTVNVADTWEQKSVLVSASPTAGTWDQTSGIGLTISFVLAAGSTFQTTAGTWETGDYLATSAQVNCLDGTSNFFRITGVRMTANTAAEASFMPFRTFNEELHMCKRYYQKSFNYATAPIQNAGINIGEHEWPANIAGANSQIEVVHLPVALRPGIATLVAYNPAAANAETRNITDGADCTATTIGQLGEQELIITTTPTAGTAIGERLGLHWTASREF